MNEGIIIKSEVMRLMYVIKYQFCLNVKEITYLPIRVYYYNTNKNNDDLHLKNN